MNERGLFLKDLLLTLNNVHLDERELYPMKVSGDGVVVEKLVSREEYLEFHIVYAAESLGEMFPELDERHA